MATEWESQGPGYFSIALFDHRAYISPWPMYFFSHTDYYPTDMPICDGVEACKRIRVLENKRRMGTPLPSELAHFVKVLFLLSSTP